MGEAISFAPFEVRRYYGERLPNLKQTSAKEWQDVCPVHKGADANFSVNAQTGMCKCFSQCDRGWDIIGLEQALTGADFKTAKTAVFRIVGRETDNWSSPKAGKAKATGQWQEVARYPYHNADGILIFEVIRFLKPDGKKTFVQHRPSGVEAAGTTDSGIRGGVPTGGIVRGLDAGMYIPDHDSSRRAGRTVWIETSHTHDGAYY